LIVPGNSFITPQRERTTEPHKQDIAVGRPKVVDEGLSGMMLREIGGMKVGAVGLGAFLPWSPLGGITKASGLGELHDSFGEVALPHGASPQRDCLAWQLSLSPTVIPTPGASRPESITDSTPAPELALSGDELVTLRGVDWPAGNRAGPQLRSAVEPPPGTG
jgi:hypothetical protein